MLLQAFEIFSCIEGPNVEPQYDAGRQFGHIYVVVEPEKPSQELLLHLIQVAMTRITPPFGLFMHLVDPEKYIAKNSIALEKARKSGTQIIKSGAGATIFLVVNPLDILGSFPKEQEMTAF